MMKNVAAKINKRLNLFVQKRRLNSGDVMLASYPKCGNTFCRFVFSRILSNSFELGGEVDFQVVQDLTPTLGDRRLNKSWNYKDFPRIIKTHEKFDRHFSNAGALIYVMRDPRDMIISYYHWMQAHKKVRYSGDMLSFVNHKDYGIRAYKQHIESWMSHWDYLFIYRDLMVKGDVLFETFFNDWKGITIERKIIEEAVTYSLPQNARKIEEDKGNEVRDELLDKGFRHVRSGKFDQWKSVLTVEELDAIERLAGPFFNQFGFNLSDRPVQS